ncbi:MULTISPECIES: DUF4440 domain-containing protein [unclassified Duganella]|uniref:nuclear transport factor 2 family protein n=1 Tax=unclassified Duganella TaxID=2636909 RepID=UPI000E34142C|nr:MULTISPECIES: DUF4440 domain-containing protein [unclassified Duganella]RFP18554.1 DUF4440 domain-containing protein [Duganella sp. BJB475]RFP35219.1 DUF4440 domain-containing protein [Duganella sp. BJB476]
MQNSDLDSIREVLSAREPIFHRRELGTSRDDLLQMTVDDFWEIGASGEAYDRDFVIAHLLERYKTPEPDDWACSDFAIRQIAQDLYQLNYVLQQPNRRTRRTTLWRTSNEGWKIVFHQGTIIG